MIDRSGLSRRERRELADRQARAAAQQARVSRAGDAIRSAFALKRQSQQSERDIGMGIAQLNEQCKAFWRGDGWKGLR